MTTTLETIREIRATVTTIKQRYGIEYAVSEKDLADEQAAARTLSDARFYLNTLRNPGAVKTVSVGRPE